MALPGEFVALEPVGKISSVITEPKPTPWSTSFFQAFNRENLELNLLRLADTAMDNEERDPNFNAWKYLEDKKEFNDVLDILLKNPDIVNNSVNEHHFLRNVERLRYEKKMVEQANANGTIPYLLGSMAAVALDPITWLTAGASHLAIKASAPIIGSTISYALGAAAEQAVSEGVLHQAQALRTTGESLFAIGLSGLIGAGVGAIFGKPVVSSGKHPTEIFEQTKTTVAEVIPDNIQGRGVIGSSIDGPKDLGAAVLKSGSEPIAGTRGSWLTRHTINRTTPLGKAVNIITEWTENLRGKYVGDGADALDDAVRTHWNVVENLLDTHLLTKENLQGIPTVSAEARRGFYRLHGVKFLQEINNVYNKTMSELGQRTTPYSTSAWKGIRQSHFFMDLGRYRLAKEGGGSFEPMGEVLQKLDPKTKQIYIKGLQEAEKYLDEVFEQFKNYEIKFGLLDPKYAKEKYYPHRYNQSAIRDNPEMFKSLLRKRFLKAPDDNWLKATYGKGWESLSDAERSIALSDWEAQRTLDITKAKEEAFAAAKQALKKARKLKPLTNKETFLQQVNKKVNSLDLQLSKIQKAESEIIKLEQDLRNLSGLKGVVSEADLTKINKQIQITTKKLESARKIVNEKPFVQKEFNEMRRVLAFINHADGFDRMLNSFKYEYKQAKESAKTIIKYAQELQPPKPLDDIVDDVFEAIVNHRKTPFGFLPTDVVEHSGRMKFRQINWGEMLASDELQQFLFVDPQKVVLGYIEDMAPRLALIENFGDEAMKTTLRTLHQKYEVALAALKRQVETASPNEKAIAEQVLEYAQDAYIHSVKDLYDLRDMFLGRFGLGEHPNESVLFWTNEIKKLNFLRLMGRTLFSSFSDPVTVSAANDVPLRKTIKAAIDILKRSEPIPSKELKRVIEGMEVTNAYNRQLLTWGIDDSVRAGHGIGHGAYKEFTAKLAETTNIGVDLMNRLNLMLPWNRAMRNIGGELFLGAAEEELPKFAKGTLPAEKVGKWARLGINKEMAARISELLHTHSKKIDDIVYPNLEAWVKADSEATRTFVQAMHTLLNEALIIPGLGDLPKFTSTTLGKLLLQFQSYNFAATNRYTRPILQKAWGNNQAIFAVTNVLSGVSLGLLGYFARVYLAGGSSTHIENQYEDLIEGKNVNLIWEGLLRSPLLGPMGMPIEFSGKVGGAIANEWFHNKTGLPGLLPGTAARTVERSAATTILGPSFGTFETFVSATTHLSKSLFDESSESEMELRRAARDVIRLMPFQNLWFLSAAFKYAQEEELIPKLTE